jgi:hypothetical protein
MTYVSELVVAGARPEHLEKQPLAVLIVGVRGDKGEPFGLHVMQVRGLLGGCAPHMGGLPPTRH